MIKRDEINNPESCLNKAHDQEHLFVLLGRDPAAPVAIRAWIAERIRMGVNTPGDEQIRDALERALLMEMQGREVVSARATLELPCNEVEITISRFASWLDRVPLRETISWSGLITLLSEPYRSPCTRETCLRSGCPHKRGACWSPALYAGADRRRQGLESLTALVFDVDRVTEDQFCETRARCARQQYLVHGTHSDRLDSRCLRFVFPLSRTVSPAEWPFLWQAARQSLVPDAESACADMTRVYFLPSCPADASYFIQVNAGARVDVDTLLTMALPPQELAGGTST